MQPNGNDKTSKPMKKQITPQYGLCIDWETSGADFGKDSSLTYQGISFGAIVFNLTDFSIVEEVYCEVQFDSSKFKWSDEAERIHGISREHLEQHGEAREDAAAILAELILKYWGGAAKIMFLGHNPEFDRRFTNQLFEVINTEFSVERATDRQGWIQLHHVMLDTSALGMIAFGLFKSDLLFEKIGFGDRGAHNALEDARQTVQTCGAVRMLVQAGMGELGV